MTSTAHTISGLADQSAYYGAFARLFHFPGADGAARLRESVDSLDPDLAGPDGPKLLSRLRGALETEDGHAFEREFNRYFAGPPACRVNETDYARLSFSMTERMADVNGFYAAFGYEVEGSSGERPDFIGTECEFAQLLLLKAAYAMDQGWREQAEITDDAYRAFLNEHLRSWAPLFADQLAKATEEKGLFGAAGPLLNAFLEAEATRLGLEGARQP